MQHFWKTLGYLRYYKTHAILNILFNILTAIFTIASFLVLKPFLDILFASEIVPSALYWQNAKPDRRVKFEKLRFCIFARAL